MAGMHSADEGFVTTKYSLPALKEKKKDQKGKKENNLLSWT